MNNTIPKEAFAQACKSAYDLQTEGQAVYKAFSDLEKHLRTLAERSRIVSASVSCSYLTGRAEVAEIAADAIHRRLQFFKGD